MQCDYFGKCGSCTLYENGYEGQLAHKLKEAKALFAPFYRGKFEVFVSKTSHFRARKEFKILHENDRIEYAMNKSGGLGLLAVASCPIVLEAIFSLMGPLREKISRVEVLRRKLAGIDFLSTTTNEVLVTLIYHKRLDDEWINEARALGEDLNISLVGRSRGQKVVLGQDYVTERFAVANRAFIYRQIENSFTQPNPSVNLQMIGWAIENCGQIGGDLLELYCGAGNFTLPLSTCFNRVLATEVSKSQVAAAIQNCVLNNIDTITFVRLSSQELTQAFKKVRHFNRLRGVDFGDFDFRAVFVDPPRSGLDDATRSLAAEFGHILYISCNPRTLLRDLRELAKTHEIMRFAFFDQFPYTHHLECGVHLVRRHIF